MDFEDRLNETFSAELGELEQRHRDRGTGPSTTVRAANLPPRLDDRGDLPGVRRWMPAAAALVLVAGLIGAVAFGLNRAEPDVDLAAGEQPAATSGPASEPTSPDADRAAEPNLSADDFAAATATPRPEPSAAAISTDEEQDADPFIHTIAAGDTLGQIAERYNVTVGSILAANPDLNPNRLRVGDRLVIDPDADAVALPAPTPEPAPEPTATPLPIQSPVPTAVPAPTLTPIDPIALCVIDIVAPDTLNVREGPGTDFLVIAELAEDDCSVNQVGRERNGWTPVQRRTEPDGPIGWVSSNFVSVESAEPEPTSPAGEQAVVRFQFVHDPDLGIPVPEPGAYEVYLPADAGSPIGRLGADGSFAFDGDQLPVTVRLEAEFPDDPFCWWTGSVEVTGPGERVVVVAALCA